jgi:hypothetical protein
MCLAVLAVGFVDALIARFGARGMALALCLPSNSTDVAERAGRLPDRSRGSWTGFFVVLAGSVVTGPNPSPIDNI